MGIYSEYLEKNMDFNALMAERKRLLTEISSLRENRDILVYASDVQKNQAPISIDHSDIIAFQDQLANLKGNAIDIILESPGGFAEVVEDLVKLVRKQYQSMAIIIPGTAKSAGTIFAMAGDEILMGPASSLGPIDAQIVTNGKRFSAEAFLEGLNKIKEEVQKNGLNLAYVPILQNISPGEIQNCENAQNFSQKLVSEWLAEYKFKTWEKHRTLGKPTSGQPVTKDEKIARAKEIGAKLCNHSNWLTHGRSIKMEDFTSMGLEITDYSADPKLNNALIRYHTLLRMTFDSTTIYKIFETPTSQVIRLLQQQIPNSPQAAESVNFDLECPKPDCKHKVSIQANLKTGVPYSPGATPYPVDSDTFVCPKCKNSINVSGARLQIEAQTKQKLTK